MSHLSTSRARAGDHDWTYLDRVSGQMTQTSALKPRHSQYLHPGPSTGDASYGKSITDYSYGVLELKGKREGDGLYKSGYHQKSSYPGNKTAEQVYRPVPRKQTRGHRFQEERVRVVWWSAPPSLPEDPYDLDVDCQMTAFAM